MTPHEFMHELEKTCDGNLESVVLYGSAVGADFSKKYSDYNLIVVLKDPSPTNLAKISKTVRTWVKCGNPPPHIFDTTHIEQSKDVFPLEFIDIADRHDLLFGVDHFKGIQINRTNLRHQCESELKGKLLYLRAYFATNCNKPKLIAEIMLKSFPSFIAVFRGVVHLLDDMPEKDNRKLIEQLAEKIEINPQVFMDLILVREGKAYLPRKEEALLAFEKYLTEIQTITTFVDRLT